MLKKIGLVLAFCFFTITGVNAGELQNAKYSINKRNVPLSAVLTDLETKTGYSILIRDNDISAEEKVSVSADNKNVREILDILFAKKNIKYDISGKQITIYKPLKEDSGNARQRGAKKSVSGTLADNSGEPIIGASVKVAGTGRGTVTDIDGNYTLPEVYVGETIDISYIGYVSQQLPYSGQAQLSVTLEEDNKQLKEVVVVGYGTQKKVNLTGSISAIDKEDLSMKPTGQLSNTLQGMAPGVTITTSTGQPGLDKGTIRIRGIGTLESGKDPLVLIDGVEADINDVDANDVVSMSILKDAAAASIYGVRAANGVILITTRRGEMGKTKITYSNYFGWQSAARLAEFVGAKDFMNLANLLAENSGKGKNFYYTGDQIKEYDNPSRDLNKYPDNYWLKDILTGSGFQQEHSVAAYGGNNSIKYSLSVNYLNQKGLIKNMDYDRYTVRMNTDIKISDQLDLNVDFSGRFSKRTEPQAPTDNSAWDQFGQAYATNPLYPIQYSDGTWPVIRGENNVIRLQKEGSKNEFKSNLFTGSAKANYQLLKDFKLTGALSFKVKDDYDSRHKRALTYFTDYPTNKETVTLGQNNIKKTSIKDFYGNYQALANYTKKLDDHNFALLAGTSYLYERSDNLMGYRTGIPNGDLSQIDAGGKNGQETSGNATEYGLLSYFARFNYNYAERYLFEANIRRDGSSQFKKDSRWGTFPSFSAGWRVSEEAFMQDISWVNNLKIRGSWGELGNDKIGLYPYQSTYSLSNYPFGGVLNQTAGLSSYANSDLTWETTQMTDIGFDFATLSNKLNFSFDYYIKTTRDVLWKLPIPSSVGLNAPYQNVGKIKNTGWEIALSYTDKVGQDFEYNVGVNLADVKNELVDIKGTDRLASNNNNIVTGLKVGQPINSFYGYDALGLYRTQEQLNTYPGFSSNVGLGDIIYKKQTESKSFSYDDMIYLGSDIPRYTYGINLGASYKGFDFSAFLQGVGKVSINTLAIQKAPTSTDGNFRKEHLNSWTSDNTDAEFPRLISSTQNYQSSSFWVKSGAYLRLKNIQLGYSIPKSLLEKSFISKFRVYVSATNLLTFTGLPSDIDPEAPNETRYYPQVKTCTFGFNLEF